MFLAQVEGGDKDLHSGTFGGIIHEPLMDLVALLGNNIASLFRSSWGMTSNQPNEDQCHI